MYIHVIIYNFLFTKEALEGLELIHRWNAGYNSDREMRISSTHDSIVEIESEYEKKQKYCGVEVHWNQNF